MEKCLIEIELVQKVKDQELDVNVEIANPRGELILIKLPIPYKQFVIVPKKPKMSTGKIASQVAHATYMALKKTGRITLDKWEKSGMCVIVLQCKDALQLIGIAEYFKQWNIPHHLYIDEGMTEVSMGTPTALATGVLTEDQHWVVSQLKLYK